ncbi:MAG: ASKHA domain-containing protein [Caldicoprobacter oshimai]
MYQVEVRQGSRLEKYSVPAGYSLLKLLKEKGFYMDSPCGGRGFCGKCKVRIVKGDMAGSQCSPDEVGHLSFIERKGGIRLACRVQVNEDLTVEVPESGQRDAAILTDGKSDVALNPMVVKRYVELPKPSLDDQASDVDRIEKALKAPGRIHPAVMRDLSETLRAHDFKVTAVFFDQDIIAVEGGDTSDAKYGVAVDIGTTTMVGFLMDLATGRQVDVYSAINPQRQYGADVITRTDFTVENENGLAVLSGLVRDEINNMLRTFCQRWGIDSSRIYHMTVVGNTIMMHLFAGLPVKNIAVSPFIPVIARRLELEPWQLDINMCPAGRITILPMVAGYVGADTIAAILASGMAERDELALLIDIGTNGEIALGNREGIITCSTAAGPAFEGAHIRYGMGGVKGAISKVRIAEDRIEYDTIGGEPARGICGSGIVDAVAQMLKAGIVDATGRMKSAEEAKVELPDGLAGRVKEVDGKPALLIASREEGAMDDIYICQKDVREVQLAKAAIASGIHILMKEMGVRHEDIQKVYLAGGFGNYIDYDHAADIGLIPSELRSKIVAIGNAAGAGAKMALLSKEYMGMAELVRHKTSYVELSSRLDFQSVFVDFLSF